MAFHGHLAVISGGASGLGRLAARRLAAQGVQVAIIDLNEKGLGETAHGYRNIHPYLCDVAKHVDVERTIAEIQNRHGQIDRLMHGAAIMPMGLLNELSSTQIVRQMHINYDGTVFLTKAVLPDMLQRRTGDIVIFGSLTGDVPSPWMAAYSATKAATNMYARQLIRENRGSGLRIALVCPPAVNTPLLDTNKTHHEGGFLALCRKAGLVIEPDFVLDEMERALEKGREVIFPGKLAQFGQLINRVAPDFSWQFLQLMEKAGDIEKSKR